MIKVEDFPAFLIIDNKGNDFYSNLIAAHDGLSDEESEIFNSRLVLILANHIGDEKILKEAIEMAKE